MKSASVFKDKAGLAADIAQKVGVGFREFQDVLTAMGLLEYYEIGTDQCCSPHYVNDTRTTDTEF